MIGDKPDADDSLTIADNAILCHDTNVYDERDARPSASSSTIRPVEPRRAEGSEVGWGGLCRRGKAPAEIIIINL